MKDWHKDKASEIRRGDIIESETRSRKIMDEVMYVIQEGGSTLRFVMKASREMVVSPDVEIEVYR